MQLILAFMISGFLMACGGDFNTKRYEPKEAECDCGCEPGQPCPPDCDCDCCDHEDDGGDGHADSSDGDDGGGCDGPCPPPNHEDE